LVLPTFAKNWLVGCFCHVLHKVFYPKTFLEVSNFLNKWTGLGRLGITLIKNRVFIGFRNPTNQRKDTKILFPDWLDLENLSTNQNPEFSICSLIGRNFSNRKTIINQSDHQSTQPCNGSLDSTIKF
jgi:hypothetical protein